MSVLLSLNVVLVSLLFIGELRGELGDVSVECFNLSSLVGDCRVALFKG